MNEEHDVRDHALSRVYREGAWPEPGRQIDQAILAASRRAARERHPLLWRWAPSFAITATVVLTSAIVLKAYREQPEVVAPAPLEKTGVVRAKQAVPEPKPEAKPTPQPAPAQQSVPTPQGYSSSMDALEAERVERAQRDLGLKELSPAGAQPPPRAAPAAKAAPQPLKKESSEAPAANRERRADAPQTTPGTTFSVFGASAPPAPAPAQAPAQAPRAVVAKPAQTAAQAPRVEANEGPPAAQAAPQPPAAEEAKPAPPVASAAVPRSVLGANVAGAVAAKPAERTPQTWIEDIRKLMKEGKSEEAGEQLAEFKKRYPDYVLPEDLR
jgi:hypothetical protein